MCASKDPALAERPTEHKNPFNSITLITPVRKAIAVKGKIIKSIYMYKMKTHCVLTKFALHRIYLSLLRMSLRKAMSAVSAFVLINLDFFAIF